VTDHTAAKLKFAVLLDADRPLLFTLAAVNPLTLHYGLSAASLDKIRDGTGPASPGYRVWFPGYERVLRKFHEDPDAFEMTYELAKEVGNVQLVLLWDNVSRSAPPL
jgi:hypothetical protein